MALSLLSPQTSEPRTYEGLEESLNVLSHKALEASLTDMEQAVELAQAFEQWAEKAASLCGQWSGSFRSQAGEMARDLRAGWPVPQVMAQLLRTLLQAHRLLEKERKGEVEKETDIPVASFRRGVEDPRAREGLFIRPEDQGLFQLFLQEAPSFLASIQSDLHLMSRGQKGDLPRVYQLFHSLQGQWGFLGFLEMKELCRQATVLLEPLLSGERAPSGDRVDVLLRVLGACRAQVDRLSRDLSRSSVEVLDSSLILEELLRNRPLLENPSEAPASPEPLLSDLGVINYSQVSDERMEKLLELLWDLTLAQSFLLEGDHTEGLTGKKAVEAARVSKLTRQMRDQLLSARMVPIQALFDQMERSRSYFAQQAGKKVRFVTEGGETEMDKQSISQLTGPLAQILKNAVDHGIESPDERARAGKDPEGVLKVKASQLAGSVILEVEDDGRGLDMEKLKRKGQALGILETEKSSAVRVMEMIFKPGVTTLENAEEGRGLGLDLVEEQVESLFGSIRVQSRSGQGCKFTLKIPKTQSLIEGWVLQAAGKGYLLPLSQVRKITHPAPEGAEGKLAASEEKVPTVHLSQWLGEKNSEDSPQFSVHVESGCHQFRVMVDEVLGKQQVMVRKTRAEGTDKPGVSGEALLPDGKIVWVLDPRQFTAGEKQRVGPEKGPQN